MRKPKTITHPLISPLLFLFAVGCHDDKPIVVANPVAADCIIDRTKAQLDCVKEAGTERQADECIAHVKATQECVDGGK
jgi:hypothetical protein